MSARGQNKKLTGQGKNKAYLQAVRVHHGEAAKGSTLAEWFEEKWRGRNKYDFGVFILRKVGRIFHLFTTSLLRLLPKNLGHLASNFGGSGKDNGRVTGFENARVFLTRFKMLDARKS